MIIHLYEVGATEQVAGRNWASNIGVNVLAPNIERAFVLFVERHPQAVIHRIEKRDRVTELIVDPDLIQVHGGVA